MPALQKEKPLKTPEQQTMYRILYIIALVHLLNDTIQSLVPAMFPVLEQSMGLSFTQLGLIAFALNFTSSLIQPVVGLYTDKRPSPYALPIGLCFTFIGILGLAFAPSFWFVIVSVAFIGLGSATFHPEGSRVANMAAGERRGFAQGVYQVGGNSGQALAPLITALVLVPLGQFGAIWFTIVAAIAIALLFYIARWYSEQVQLRAKIKATKKIVKRTGVHKKNLYIAIVLLIFFVFARSWFQSGITNFYAFFIIEKYGLSIEQAQVYLFIFLATGAIGTFAGGPLADRFGKKIIIMLSMLLSTPLTLLLPYVGKVAAYPLVALIGFIVLSSFSVTVVYAQDLFPGKIGTVSGLIVGLAFGMGAIGSIALGKMADTYGLMNTMLFTAFLPLLGLVSIFLPSDGWIAKHNK
ncbi:MFS transporter [bacterium LRH843]|nr:MFS transporter [bacterium LRH843]